VINTNLAPILHRFRNITFDRSKIAIFGFLLCLTPSTEGFPWDDLRKIVHRCQQMASVPNGVKTLPTISCVGRTNVTGRQTDRRQTDRRTTTYSQREREITFTKTMLNLTSYTFTPHLMMGQVVGGFNQRQGEALPPQIFLTLKLVVCIALKIIEIVSTPDVRF